MRPLLSLPWIQVGSYGTSTKAEKQLTFMCNCYHRRRACCIHYKRTIMCSFRSLRSCLEQASQYAHTSMEVHLNYQVSLKGACMVVCAGTSCSTAESAAQSGSRQGDPPAQPHPKACLCPPGSPAPASDPWHGQCGVSLPPG